MAEFAKMSQQQLLEATEKAVSGTNSVFESPNFIFSIIKFI